MARWLSEMAFEVFFSQFKQSVDLSKLSLSDLETISNQWYYEWNEIVELYHWCFTCFRCSYDTEVPWEVEKNGETLIFRPYAAIMREIEDYEYHIHRCESAARREYWRQQYLLHKQNHPEEYTEEAMERKREERRQQEEAFRKNSDKWIILCSNFEMVHHDDDELWSTAW